MPVPLNDAEKVRRLDAIHAALEEGFLPPDQYRVGKTTAVIRASEILGDVSPESLKSNIRNRAIQPDWRRYKPPESLSKMVRIEAEAAREKIEHTIKVRVSAAPPKGPQERLKVCAIGDVHDSPEIEQDRADWLGQWIAREAPDLVIQIGDFADLDSLNSHVRNETFHGRAKPTFEQDVASLKQFLDRMGSHIKTRPEMHCTLGNHEYRAWRAEDEAPHTAGMMQALLDEAFSANGWTYSPYGEVFHVGGVGYTHAPFGLNGKPVAGKTSANIVARDSVYDTVMGHTHRMRHHREAKLGRDQRVVCIDLGCALPDGYVMPYARDNGTGWWYGAHVINQFGGRIEGHTAISMRELEEASQ